MDKLKFTAAGELEITPSATSSQNDFDQLVGEWDIHHRKLTSRLTNSDEWIEFDATQEMRKVLTGIGNVETMAATVNGKPFEGMAVRLFNPATRLWSIYWADNNTGTLDKPVVGSFENNVGRFYSREIFNNREVILQFQWDVTNPEKPVWSQAYSTDNGTTWEWNWYMYFTRKSEERSAAADQQIKVIELRRYLVKPNQRDSFIQYFEDNLVQAQNDIGGYVLGQYRTKGFGDDFFWIRGFTDMSDRNRFLNDFYYGDVWKAHKNTVNPMLLNNDNVHLLKPLNDASFESNWFGQQKGIAVIDYYTSNQKLHKLTDYVRKKYLAVLTAAKVINTSFWVSESATNEFVALPVFQDMNLLVQITFYKDELDYQSTLNKIDSLMDDSMKIEMADLVTVKNTLIIYPTDRSFKN
jgi:hypothetical protein